jgi:hypothetical protein
MRDFVINSTVNSSPNEKKTMAGFIGEKSGLVAAYPPETVAVAPREEKDRYLPLDAYRGLIMLLLVADGFGLSHLPEGSPFHFMARQFEHNPWGGAVFYDLIMPAFLFNYAGLTTLRNLPYPEILREEVRLQKPFGRRVGDKVVWE